MLACLAHTVPVLRRASKDKIFSLYKYCMLAVTMFVLHNACLMAHYGRVQPWFCRLR